MLYSNTDISSSTSSNDSGGVSASTGVSTLGVDSGGENMKLRDIPMIRTEMIGWSWLLLLLFMLIVIGLVPVIVAVRYDCVGADNVVDCACMCRDHSVAGEDVVSVSAREREARVFYQQLRPGLCVIFILSLIIT